MARMVELRRKAQEAERTRERQAAAAAQNEAEEREKNIGWIKRLLTAWRVSHTERRAEREEAGEEDSEEDETPVVIPSSAVTMHPKGTPAPKSSVEVQVFEERDWT